MASQRGPRRQLVGQSAWPDLPPELLEHIVAILGPRDRIAVRLVCASWRACVREWFPSELPFDPPRLLLRRPGPGGELAFFSLRDRRILPYALPAHLGAGRCCGHAAGWLAMALDSDRAVVLCNPASGQSVAVPRLPVFPVSKVVLSAPPSSPGWVAAVLSHLGRIVLLQPESCGAWMTIGIKEGAEHGGFGDMAFWRGRLCALCHDGAVLAFRADLRARTAAVSLLRGPEPQLRMELRRLYLVESDGELLLLTKQLLRVEVYRLESPEQRKWDKAEETPGRALFVGSVASAVVPVELYEAAVGLRESCVYFARREVEMLAPHAIYEYSLPDGTITGVPVAGGHSTDVEPVWITPFV